MNSINLTKEDTGVLNSTMEGGKIKTPTYEGDSDLLVISRDTRTQLEKKSKGDVAMKTLLTLSLTVLLGVGMAEFVNIIVSLIVMLIGIIIALPWFATLLQDKVGYTNARPISAIGNGKVIRVLEKDLNDIVKLQNGEIKRIYQLIDDKDIIDNIEIKRGELIDYYLPVGLIENKITHTIKNESPKEDMTIEGRAIYNIGQSIPLLEDTERDSIIKSLDKVYKHKTNVENSEEYEKEYTKLLEDNKNIDEKIPQLQGSQEYLRKELGKINDKVNKELNENKQIVKGIT